MINLRNFFALGHKEGFVKAVRLDMPQRKTRFGAMPDILKWGNAVKLLIWTGGARWTDDYGLFFGSAS
jgi:hypothetical protein